MRWLSLLQEIRGLKLDLARLDPRAGMPVLPPLGAAPRAIEAVERRLGRALPPSYRELLEVHDGVPQLYHGASLLGTKPLARGTYVDLTRMVIDAPGVSGSDLVPFGIDATGETIFAWDRAGASEDGELEVVVWVNEIVERVESFPAFLELVREMLTAEIDDRRRAAAPASRRRALLSEPTVRFAAA
ncbi:Hypothetical protein A7982_00101 [Minicystis rosea]|nr:Hypothetical protein A7982_00101 [Minicystis rosea]